MRTTIRLDDRLIAEVKRLALDSGRTMTAFIEEALREAIARRKPRRTRSTLKLKTVGGRGLLPGIDLDDSAGLRDLMDRGNDSP
jgi:Arc/MetJ family transcription regulator